MYNYLIFFLNIAKGTIIPVTTFVLLLLIVIILITVAAYDRFVNTF